MSRVDQKLAFDRWCASFNIEGERKDRLWSIMVANSLTPDDVNVYFLGAAGVLEKVADQVDAATGALPARIEAAARRAVGPIADAAAAQVEARHASLATDTASRIAVITSERLDAEFRTRRFRDFGLVVVLSVGLALLVGLMGYGLGTRSIAELEAGIRAIAVRSDLSTVMAVLRGNPDLDATISSYCASGSGAVRVVEGVRNCSLPLWIDGRPASVVPVYGGQALVTFWNAGAGFLNRFSGWTILGMGLVTGIALRHLFAFGRKVVG